MSAKADVSMPMYQKRKAAIYQVAAFAFAAPYLGYSAIADIIKPLKLPQSSPPTTDLEASR